MRKWRPGAKSTCQTLKGSEKEENEGLRTPENQPSGSNVVHIRAIVQIITMCRIFETKRFCLSWHSFPGELYGFIKPMKSRSTYPTCSEKSRINAISGSKVTRRMGSFLIVSTYEVVIDCQRMGSLVSAHGVLIVTCYVQWYHIYVHKTLYI